MKKKSVFNGKLTRYYVKKLCLMMRLMLFLMWVSVFVANANTASSQSVKFTAKFEGSTLAEVFEMLEKQSNIGFLVPGDLLKDQTKISLSFKEAAVEDVLHRILDPRGYEFEFVGKNVVITQKAGQAAVAQQRVVKGQVTNSMGEPIPGVTIVVKGTNQGTISDAEGHFTLTNVTAETTLIFSFVGMRSQEIIVGGETTLDVVMEEEAIGIEEVVAVGYGTQKKVNLTGAVAVASKEIFENKSVPNAIAAIQGTLPGVTVTKSSGKPGSENYNLQIRGASSINSVGVLVIIDGVTGNLSDINPNDIESMSVLKDAAAAAIYGSNAAGGVILITTKKGQAGKTVIEYKGMYGITNMGRMPHPTDAYTQMSTLALGYRNAGTPTLEWEDPVRLAWLRGERLDETDYVGAKVEIYPTGRFFVTKSRPNVWQSANSIDQVKEYTKDNNPIQTHNVSVSGGNDKNRYFFSTGYYNRRGILRYGPDSNERYNMRLNVNNELSKNISLNSSVAFANNNIYQPSTSPETILRYAYRFWSTGVTYGPTGEYFASHGLWPSWVQVMREGGKNTRNEYRFDGKTELKIEDLLPGLEVNVIGSGIYGVNKQLITKRTLTYIGPLGTPTLIYQNPNNMSKNSYFSKYSSLQGFATYELNIKESHNFKLLGGYSYEDYKDETISAGAKNLVTNDFFSLGWGDADTKTNSDQITSWATMAAFGRLNYNFKEKYLFEANLRYDASSRLSPSNRWNAFPSLSAGWNIGKEDFFQNVKTIQDLKLRASWGQLGNSNALGLYDYIALLNAAANLPFNDAPTQYIYQSTLASESKTWETVETANIGIDLTSFNRRLSFSADAYIKKNKNMLVNLQVPAIIGVGVSSYNYGELKTRGWDIAISWKEMSGKFKYWVTVNLSDNTNKLVHYQGKNIVSAGQVSLIEGLPLNTMWGYKTDGLFQSDQEYQEYGVFISSLTGAGDMKYLDLDGNKKITVGAGTLEDHGDLVRLGDTNPRYLFGINLGFKWKGIDFSSFFQGVGKRNFSMFNGDMWSSMFTVYSDAISMPFREQLDYWTTENPDAFWPRPYNNGMQSYWPSDYWIQDAAYIRLKNIEIGYTIPQSLVEKVHLSKVRFFVTGQDLWESTKTFSYIDPESPDNASFIYPFYRTISLGLNVQF